MSDTNNTTYYIYKITGKIKCDNGREYPGTIYKQIKTKKLYDGIGIKYFYDWYQYSINVKVYCLGCYKYKFLGYTENLVTYEYDINSLNESLQTNQLIEIPELPRVKKIIG